jgi:cytochrome bd-type quinol oxidase subunit 2
METETKQLEEVKEIKQVEEKKEETKRCSLCRTLVASTIVIFVIFFQFLIWEAYVRNGNTWQKGVWKEKCIGTLSEKATCVMKVVCDFRSRDEDSLTPTSSIVYYQQLNVNYCLSTIFPIYFEEYVDHSSGREYASVVNAASHDKTESAAWFGVVLFLLLCTASFVYALTVIAPIREIISCCDNFGNDCDGNYQRRRQERRQQRYQHLDQVIKNGDQSETQSEI